MPGIYRLTFLPDGRTQKFAGLRGDYYRLAGESEITLYSGPVWCAACAKVTHGEHIESIQEIDRRSQDLERLAAEIRREMSRPPLPASDGPAIGTSRSRSRNSSCVVLGAGSVARRRSA